MKSTHLGRGLNSQSLDQKSTPNRPLDQGFHQCDHMAGLFVQYLTIFNDKFLPKFVKIA